MKIRCPHCKTKIVFNLIALEKYDPHKARKERLSRFWELFEQPERDNQSVNKTLKAISEQMGISRATAYRYLKTPPMDE